MDRSISVELSSALERQTFVSLSNLTAPGIDQDDLTRFRILELDQADIGQPRLPRVRNGDGDEIMPSPQYPKRLLEALGLKVADEEDHRPSGLNPSQVIESPGDIGSGCAWDESSGSLE